MSGPTVKEAREELERLFPQVTTHPGQRSVYLPTDENRRKVPALAKLLRKLATATWPRAIAHQLDAQIGALEEAAEYWRDARSQFELRSPPRELDPIRALHELLKAAPEATPEVFIVHGWDHAFRDAMVELLRALGVAQVTFIDAIGRAGGGTQSNWSAVCAGLEAPGGVVALWTGDETVQVGPHLQESAADSGVRHQPRPNVIGETFAAMRHHQSRTVIVVVVPATLPSDLDGLNTSRFADTAEWRLEFAARLETMGLQLTRDADGAWLRAGTFPTRPAPAAPGAAPAVLEDIRDLLEGQERDRSADRLRLARDEHQRFYAFGQSASGGSAIEIVFTNKGGPNVRDAQITLSDAAAGSTWGPFKCKPAHMPPKGQGFAKWENPPSMPWPKLSGALTWISNGMRWQAPLTMGSAGAERLFTSSVDSAECLGPADD